MEWKRMTPTPQPQPEERFELCGKNFKISIFRGDNSDEIRSYGEIHAYGLINEKMTDIEAGKPVAFAEFRKRLAAALAELDSMIPVAAVSE